MHVEEGLANFVYARLQLGEITQKPLCSSVSAAILNYAAILKHLVCCKLEKAMEIGCVLGTKRVPLVVIFLLYLHSLPWI